MLRARPRTRPRQCRCQVRFVHGAIAHPLPRRARDRRAACRLCATSHGFLRGYRAHGPLSRARRRGGIEPALLSCLSRRVRPGAAEPLRRPRLPHHGREHPRSTPAPAAGAERAGARGDRERLLPPSLQLEGSHPGLARPAGPPAFSPLRLSHGHAHGCRDQGGGRALRALRPRPALARELAPCHRQRCAPCADLSGSGHGPGLGQIGRPAPCPRAVHVLGPSRHQRLSHPRLFHLERDDGAARRRGALQRAPGQAAQSLDLLRAAAQAPARARSGGARLAQDGHRLLVRPVALEVPASVRSGFRAHRARGGRLPIRLHPERRWGACERDVPGAARAGVCRLRLARCRPRGPPPATRARPLRGGQRDCATSSSTASAGPAATRAWRVWITTCRS